MVINVEEGMATVIERFGVFNRIVGHGKHILIPLLEKDRVSFRIGLQTLKDDVHVDGYRPIKTMDGIKVGYNYKIDVDVVDATKFYKGKYAYPFFSGLKVDTESIISKKLLSFKYAEIVDMFTESKESNWMELSTEELQTLKNESEKDGIKVIKVHFSPYVFGTNYEYYKSFCNCANVNGNFTSVFGRLTFNFNNNNEFELKSNDGRYVICLCRDKMKDLVHIEVRIKNQDGHYDTLVQYKNEIEKELQWNFNWAYQDGKFSVAKATMQSPDYSYYNKDIWHRQYNWIIDMTIKIKKIFSRILDMYGAPDVIEIDAIRVELEPCICKHCGGPIHTGMKICPYCDAGQTINTN